MVRPLALVVEQDSIVRAVVRNLLEKQDLAALAAESGSEAMELLRTHPVSVVVCDIETPGVDAFELLRYTAQLQPPRVVVVIAPFEDGARENVLRAGAFDALSKPLDDAQLRQAIYRAIRQWDLIDELRRLRENLQSREGYYGLVGRSAAMDRLRQQLERLAASTTPACFVGEVGSGKEHAARTLHATSGDPERPFLAIPCAGLSSTDWSSAPTLNRARGGTLFLEELSALPQPAQEDLTKNLIPAARQASVRILSSSVRDPRRAVEEGRLLEEVRRALAEETVLLPALRERVDDIPLLAAHFLRAICEINHIPAVQLSPDALRSLQNYRWPENVQELRQAIEHAVILARDGGIGPGDLPDRIRIAEASDSGVSRAKVSASRQFRDAKREVVEAFERAYLRDLMMAHGGNVTAASHHAGMLRSALQRLLRKYGMRSAEFRRPRRSAVGEEAHADG